MSLEAVPKGEDALKNVLKCVECLELFLQGDCETQEMKRKKITSKEGCYIDVLLNSQNYNVRRNVWKSAERILILNVVFNRLIFSILWN